MSTTNNAQLDKSDDGIIERYSSELVEGAPDPEAFDSLAIQKNLTMDSIQRRDRNGNVITTEIGRFSLVSSRKSSSKKKSVVGAGTGGKEEENEKNGEEPQKKPRHRVTFMDEVTFDKSKLTEVHLIESYKKYNQEFYVENQVEGCCTIF